MRRLLTPRWLGFHLLTFGSIAAFLVLGRWQWLVGESDRGTFRNFGYGLEWWVFSIILLVCWAKLMRAELKASRQPGDQPDGGAGGRPSPVAAPTPADAASAAPPEDDDPELAAYNRYLASLYERDRQRVGG